MLLALLHLPCSLWQGLSMRLASGVLVLRLCWWCWRICELVEVVLCLLPRTHFGCFSWEGEGERCSNWDRRFRVAAVWESEVRSVRRFKRSPRFVPLA
ncbi:hypothetical protein KC19_9G112800 [Ceratodon purpureus]|uniref:Uncharacterized protein n=1 Tax=Ceratodon purpureus TaxID=3225 RepID=A0A8T0GQY5_CERPU|nr:hypothetical protein KC19_9G112800 [Ceratodon purpureus]